MRHQYLYIFILLSTLIKSNAQVSYKKDTYNNIVDCQGFISVIGSTNVNDFEFTSDISTQKIEKENSIKNIQIKIPVKNLKTKNSMMYRDFLKLVKADKYPDLDISFNLNLENTLLSDNTVFIPVELTLAGKKMTYKIPIQITRCPGNQLTVLGGKKLNLTDFSLNPPKKMNGLVKVNNEIFINFGLVFHSQ